MSALIDSFSTHPIAQAIRSYAEQYAAQTGPFSSNSDTNAFVPPVDIFATPSAYILHIALPGAKKEDVGVNWDAEKSELNVAGVVYRPGDEEFIKNLKRGERRVGVFERNVKLPLAGGAIGEEGEKEREEIDGDNITAKLEDGVLVVTVPKVEKEWTDVKKVDIE
jgi:HSP20 family protein